MGDETIGNLDSKNSELVFDVLRKLSYEFEMTDGYNNLAFCIN